MQSLNSLCACVLISSALGLASGAARAEAQPPAGQPAPTSAPAAAAAPERMGDPYPLGTCPISGKKLGAMGDPVAKLYAGREVRFCCAACPAKFEKDLAASSAALDEGMVKDQLPRYPLKTSVVTGQPLPEKPVDFVYGNRLVRLGAESEKASFLNHAPKFLADLDAAVVAKQGEHYVLAACPVSGEKFGGDMGEVRNVVIAGRLIRLCCNSCKDDVEKDPAKFIALVDAAGGDRAAKPEGDQKGEHEGHHADHKNAKPSGG